MTGAASGGGTTPCSLVESGWRGVLATPGGYAWWYVDALDEKGDGLVAIFLVGSVFSPLYALRRAHGERALPEEHCAVNLCLYRGGKRIAWVMSEYPGCEIEGAFEEPGGEGVRIGRSRILRSSTEVRFLVEERSMPLRRAVRGEIVIEPLSLPWPALQIGDDARRDADPFATAGHAWQAITPRARVRASFEAPAHRIDALGYHDTNYGTAPLDESFDRWGWARFHDGEHTTVAYAFTDRDGGRRSVHLRGDSAGHVEVHADTAPPEGPLHRLAWGMTVPERFTGGPLDSPEGPPRFACAPCTFLEEDPFYARYRAELHEPGRTRALSGLGEYIDFRRFAARHRLFLIRYATRNGMRRPFLF
jgi:carotenoid 1,2-hydratase